MRLHTLAPAAGSRRARKRVGRGTGSGTGKTCGRGHKGQKSRAGSSRRVGFEGGQMPLQRRLPKSGFASRRPPCPEVRSGALGRVAGDEISLQSLKAAGLIPKGAARARIILQGDIARAFAVSGVALTRGARAALERAGGSVRED